MNIIRTIGGYFSKLLPLLLLFVLVGCGPQHFFYLNRLRMKQVHYHYSQDTSLRHMKRFTVLPYKMQSDRPLVGAEQHQLERSLMNRMQLNGYRYVPNIDSSDFVVTGLVSHEIYDEDSKPVFPYPVSWELHDEKDHSMLFGDTTITAATLPKTQVIPKTPWYRPSLWRVKVSIFVYDTKTDSILADADTWGVTEDSSLFPAAQTLVGEGIYHLSTADPYQVNCEPGDGQIGIYARSVSPDGVDFWPVIWGVTKDSPAEVAGLRYGEVILRVDGVSMRNRTLDDFLCACRGPALTIRTLTMAGDPPRTIQLTMKPRSN